MKRTEYLVTVDGNYKLEILRKLMLYFTWEFCNICFDFTNNILVFDDTNLKFKDGDDLVTITLNEDILVVIDYNEKYPIPKYYDNLVRKWIINFEYKRIVDLDYTFKIIERN